MTAQHSELALQMKRVIDAPRPLVFKALTEPAELAKWWGPSGFTIPRVEIDLRVGGSYRIAMQPPDGELFYLSGEFREVDPPGHLAYTFRWEDPDPDDRETLRAFAAEGRRALHEQGWTQGLDRLQELVTPTLS